MVRPRRWHVLVATVAAWIAGAASGLAYAPRLATPEIPSSPPIPAYDVAAQPVENWAFTLDPRMGFFAAGDPVNGMDPDGRVGKQIHSFNAAISSSPAMSAVEFLSPTAAQGIQTGLKVMSDTMVSTGAYLASGSGAFALLQGPAYGVTYNLPIVGAGYRAVDERYFDPTRAEWVVTCRIAVVAVCRSDVVGF